MKRRDIFAKFGGLDGGVMRLRDAFDRFAVPLDDISVTEPPPATQMRQQGRRYLNDLTPLLVLPLAARKPVKHAWRKSHHGRPTGRTGSMEELQMTLATAAT